MRALHSKKDKISFSEINFSSLVIKPSLVFLLR